MKNIRLGMLLMLLFVLLATALPPITTSIYKEIFSDIRENKKISLYLHESEEIKYMSHDDYILGITLSALNGKKYSMETIYAACVAMRSASLYLKEACKELCGSDADYCDCDFGLSFVFPSEFSAISEENAEIVAIVSQAIAETDGKILLYKNSYALALMHRSSYITTESSYNVWGKEYPYLEPVITPEKAEISEIYVLESEFSRKLGEKFENMKNAGVSASPTLKLNRAGRVESVNVFLTDISAIEFAEIFGILSMNFEIEEAYGGYVIRVYGEGNGIGMSLAGAEKMAQDGFSHSDILLYYYRACKIVSGNDEFSK